MITASKSVGESKERTQISAKSGKSAEKMV